MFLHFATLLLFALTVHLLVRWTLRPTSPFRSIPGPPPKNWFSGNLLQLFNAKGLQFHHNLTRRYGDVVKIWGFFGDEQLYISDPQALHHIIKDQQDAFEETTTFIETNKVIFGEGLVATVGEQHKRQRKVVSPAFSVPQLRKLVPIFYQVAARLKNAISSELDEARELEGGAVLDMSQWMSRAALESVGQGILGYSFDPLNSRSSNRYTQAVRELIPALFSVSLIRQFAPFLHKLGSPSFRRKLVEWTPHGTVQKIKDMSDVMYDTAKSILQKKKELLDKEGAGDVPDEGALESEGLRDIISGLLRENQRSQADEHLSDDEIIGQMTVLIFGGQDTTSSILSRILYMLASHPGIQDNLRSELRNVLEDSTPGEATLGYEQISKLPWMDAVLKETLRLYPPVPFVRRVATRTTTIPLSTPIKPRSPSGRTQEPLTTLTIPTGTTLFVGIAAANRANSVWGDDALTWRPERWLNNATSNGDGSDPSIVTTSGPARRERLPGIYAGMLSFLDGGRSCVGYRFAQLEIKIILAVLLDGFSFALAPADMDIDIVWNLSQIISPSYTEPKKPDGDNGGVARQEKQGMPLLVRKM